MSSLTISSSNLELSATLVESDSKLFGIPVYSIDVCRLLGDIHQAKKEARELLSPTPRAGEDISAIYTARISGDNLLGGEFLQESGFRFRELSLHPRLEVPIGFRSIVAVTPSREQKIVIEPAILSEEILNIASSCFRVSRFHQEPAISNRLADLRFRNWLQQAIEEPRNQNVVQLKNSENQVIGFFVRHTLENAEVNWQLTGISSQFQSRGIGKSVWASMVDFEVQSGTRSISSTISAENFPVVGLYPKYGFKFVRSSKVYHLVVR